MRTTAGFKELPHAADLCLQVWAPTLAGLFREAARGMNALAGARLQGSPRIERCIRLAGEDNEQLLVGFLSELILLADQEKLAFDHFVIRIQHDQLTAILKGAPLLAAGRTIKAATYHNLQIKQKKNRCEAVIVFDI